MYHLFAWDNGGTARNYYSNDLRQTRSKAKRWKAHGWKVKPIVIKRG